MVAGALSRLHCDFLTASASKLAIGQKGDDELGKLSAANSLQLENLTLPHGKLLANVHELGLFRPHVPVTHRRRFLDLIHGPCRLSTSSTCHRSFETLLAFHEQDINV